MQVIVFTCLLSSLAWGLSPLSPHLQDSFVQEAFSIRENLDPSLDLESLEIRYQNLVQPQTLADLKEIYDPANKALVQLTYASFTPIEENIGGDDLGFGLHIVKRLTKVLPTGETKVIDVNELWPNDAVTGGLFLPDEIRIKTRVIDGDRKSESSYKDYLFDVVRLAWGPQNKELTLARRLKYSWNGKESEDKMVRVPVSAPFSCFDCHYSGNSFAKDFLQKGEKRNFESIVQNTSFTISVETQRGFKQYAQYLETKKKLSQNERTTILQNLLDQKRVAEVPLLFKTLSKMSFKDELTYLPEDFKVYGIPELLKKQTGVYPDFSGTLFQETLQELIEGKYRWWNPALVVPFQPSQTPY